MQVLSQVTTGDIVAPPSDETMANTFESPINMTGQGVGLGLSRTRSLFSMSSSSTASQSSETSLWDENDHDSRSEVFGRDVRIYTQGNNDCLTFDAGLRKTLEPHLRTARLLRERSRSNRTTLKVEASIADSVGVPYTPLRNERPFLFDEHTHPLHEILARTLQVEDLTRLHELDATKLLDPLRDPERRLPFHSAYDNFITSFCIPLLHSIIYEKNILHTSSSDQITYRYQAFPTIRIVRPGEVGKAPTCDTAVGHSIGYLNFHVPLTPSYGTNALYTESHPGREDWHPLLAKAVGLGYLYDGARCLHFEPDNTTSETRVSLDFRIMVYREFYGRMSHDGGLCPEEYIEDRFSRLDSNFYDEAVVDFCRTPCPGLDVVVKKNGNRLLRPSQCLGRPF